MSGGAKLLIPHGSAAVAEGRQARLHRHIQTTEAPATRLSWLRVVASAQRVLAVGAQALRRAHHRLFANIMDSEIGHTLRQTGDLAGAADESPVTAVTISRDFWMSACEITNEIGRASCRERV